MIIKIKLLLIKQRITQNNNNKNNNEIVVLTINLRQLNNSMIILDLLFITLTNLLNFNIKYHISLSQRA